MSELYLSRDQVRAVDRYAIETLGLPGVVLMENAGRGAAQLLLETSPSRVLIVCGKGNNGGDGYVIGRHLVNAGVDVCIVSIATEPLLGDAELHQQVWLASGERVEAWSDRMRGESYDWIVDAMLGTGARGALREPVANIVESLNRMGASRFAVDVPTGMDCDSGECGTIAFQPDMTCTFVALKLGFQWADAAALGDVRVVDIGVPEAAIRYGMSVEPSANRI